MKKIVLSAFVFCTSAGMVFADTGLWGEGNDIDNDTVLRLMRMDQQKKATGDYLFDRFSGIRLGKNDITWSGAMNFSVPTESDADAMVNLQIALGYFVNDYVEGEAAIFWVDAGDDSGVRFSLGANNYFGEWLENIFPYVGGSLSTWSGDFKDEDEGGTHFQAKAGIRHYLARHVGLRYWLEYDTDVKEMWDGKGYFSGYIGIFGHPH